MNHSHKLFLAVLMVFAAFAAQAQEFRIGVVNIDRIFREANSAKAAQAKLEQEFGKREKELGDLGTQLKSLADKFEREAPTLSESQRTNRQKQLVEQDRDFQRKRREFQEDLNARKNEELQQVIERANKVVKTVAETEKYDLVLQEAVYANPKHDITDKVIRALNAGR
jgi:outer membrane protein